MFDCCTLRWVLSSAVFLYSRKWKIQNCSITRGKKISISIDLQFSVHAIERTHKKEHKIDIFYYLHRWWLKINIPCIQKEKFCNFFACLEWWTENIHRVQIFLCWLLTVRKMLKTTMGELFRFDFIYSSCYHSLRKIYNFLHFLIF